MKNIRFFEKKKRKEEEEEQWRRDEEDVAQRSVATPSESHPSLMFDFHYLQWMLSEIICLKFGVF